MSSPKRRCVQRSREEDIKPKRPRLLVLVNCVGSSPLAPRSDLRPLCSCAAALDPLAGGSPELLQSNFRREAAEMDEAPLIENQRGFCNPPVLIGGYYIHHALKRFVNFRIMSLFFHFSFSLYNYRRFHEIFTHFFDRIIILKYYPNLPWIKQKFSKFYKKLPRKRYTAIGV